MSEGSGGSYGCRCPFCGGPSQRDHGEPPQLCFDCRDAGVDLDMVQAWRAVPLPVKRYDGTVR